MIIFLWIWCATSKFIIYQFVSAICKTESYYMDSMNIENFNFPLTLSVCFGLYSIVCKDFSVLFSSWLCYCLFGFYGIFCLFLSQAYLGTHHVCQASFRLNSLPRCSDYSHVLASVSLLASPLPILSFVISFVQCMRWSLWKGSRGGPM